MANALYDKGREGFLDGSFDWISGSIKAVLVDTASYSVNLATDQFISSIPSGERVATSANLTSKTATAGVADAADITLSAVTGDQSEAIVIYNDTGVDTTSRLIAYIDTATGLPVTPNGGDITISFNASGIFKL